MIDTSAQTTPWARISNPPHITQCRVKPYRSPSYPSYCTSGYRVGQEDAVSGVDDRNATSTSAITISVKILNALLGGFAISAAQLSGQIADDVEKDNTAWAASTCEDCGVCFDIALV